MKVLVFQYDCGWEFPVRMEAGMNKTSLVARLSREVTRKHRRTCKVCRKDKITFTTAADSTSQFVSDPFDATNRSGTPPTNTD